MREHSSSRKQVAEGNRDMPEGMIQGKRIIGQDLGEGPATSWKG
jgi:hypothetical protein